MTLWNSKFIIKFINPKVFLALISIGLKTLDIWIWTSISSRILHQIKLPVTQQLQQPLTRNKQSNHNGKPVRVVRELNRGASCIINQGYAYWKRMCSLPFEGCYVGIHGPCTRRYYWRLKVHLGKLIEWSEINKNSLSSLQLQNFFKNNLVDVNSVYFTVRSLI